MSTPSPRKRKLPIPSSPPSAQNGRLFTDSEEICLLKTFQKLNKATQSSSSSSSSITATLTVESSSFKRINSALSSKFTHAQITDKLRRLRIKYHKQARSKSLIKTPHDQEFFEIAQRIWGKKTKDKKVENRASTDVEEEEEVEEDNEQHECDEVDLEDYPVLVSEFSKYLPPNLVWREALKSLGNGKLKEMNDKWTMIGIEETKIVTKKAELVKEQANLVMQVLADNTANWN